MHIDKGYAVDPETGLTYKMQPKQKKTNMNLYAVAYMNFLNNELTIELVEANTVVGAIAMHSKTDVRWLEHYPNDIHQLRMLFLELDMAVDVVEITQKIDRTILGIGGVY